MPAPLVGDGTGGSGFSETDLELLWTALDRAGVQHLWLSDTEYRIAEAFELWHVAGTVADEDVICLAPFATVPVDAEELWEWRLVAATRTASSK